MKKLITLLLALAMVLSLTACGEQPTGAAGDDGNTVSAESDGRTLYEAAIQLACDGDFPGSIEGLKKAVAAEETDTWNEMDIDLAYKRMAQLYLLLGDTEGQAQANADCLTALGWEAMGLDELYFENSCFLGEYFDVSPFGAWGSNVLIYNLENGATVVVRPSGTEPKIKVYILTIGDGAAARDENLRKYGEWVKTLQR